MRSRLRRNRQPAPVDSCEDGVTTTFQKGCAGFVADFFWIVPVAGVAQELGTVGVSDDRFQVKPAIFHFCESADGNLAASTETVEQGALAGGGGAGVGVIQKAQERTRFGVTFTNFDTQRSLSGGGAHDFGGDNLLDQFGFAEAFQPGRGENDGVVLSLLEFAQAGIHIAAQGMDVEIGPNGLELCLAAQARRTYPSAFWK